MTRRRLLITIACGFAGKLLITGVILAKWFLTDIPPLP